MTKYFNTIINYFKMKLQINIQNLYDGQYRYSTIMYLS